MSVPLRSQYDMTLTIGGKNYGYQLWEDPNGQKHWNEGLAPLITPQQRITEFSYEHIPPEIDLPAAFEDWSGGSGSTEFLATQQLANGFYQINSNTPKTYNYSQGVDASWGNRLYLSPLYTDADTIITSTINFFYTSNQYGTWAVAGALLYKWNIAGQAWVLKYTAAAAIRSITECSGVMYISLTNSAYAYASDGVGTTWTVFTGANLESGSTADYFVTRGNVLMAMLNEQAYVTTNGQNGGVAWSAGTHIGNTSESTKSLAVANNIYWIFKTQGIYSWDGTTVSQVWSPEYIESTNGTSAYVWYDGNIYTVYGSRILAIDPFNTQTSTLQFVYPLELGATLGKQEPHDSVEIKGTISQITGTFTDLVFTVTNPAGGCYIMKGDPRTQVYHTLAYLGTSVPTTPIVANTACLAAGAGFINTTNPCLLTGMPHAASNTKVQLIILPRSDLRPEDDPNYKYNVFGAIYGPWMSFGARSFNKFLNRGSILGTNITAGQNVQLYYQIDDITTNTTLIVDAIDYRLNSANIVNEISFYRIRYIIVMNATNVGVVPVGPNGPAYGLVTSRFSASTPIVVGATMHATMNPPRRRIWKPLIGLKLNGLLRDGNEDNQDVTTLRNALYAAAESRITMTDRENNSYIVRILDIQEQQLTFSTEGGTETESQVLQVSLAEIEAISSQLPIAHYTQARYHQGYIYG